MKSLPRRAQLFLEIGMALAICAATVFERCLDGLQTEFLLIVALTGPLHVRRILALRGDGPGPGLLPSLLEIAAVTGTLTGSPPAPWTLTLATLALVVDVAAAPPDTTPAPAWVTALGPLALLVAALGAWDRFGVHPRGIQDFSPQFAMLVLPALAPTFLEALVPGALRSREAALRRAAVAASGLAASRADGFMGELPSFVWLTTISLLWLVVIRRPLDERLAARRRLVRGLAASTATLVLVWVLGEVAFRVVPNQYRDLQPNKPAPWHVPGETTVYEGAVYGPPQSPVATRWSHTGGWHDRDHSIEKPAGTVRIVVLGDSYVEGVQVPLERLYHSGIERELAARGDAAVECLAFGYAGWGQADELGVLEREGLAYAPDLVLLEFLPSNDVRNNHPELERLANEETYHATLARSLFLWAVTWRLPFAAFVLDHTDRTIRNLQGRKDVFDMDVFREEPRGHADLWRDAWVRTEELVVKIQERARRRAAPLVVVIFTGDSDIEACVPDAPTIPGYDLRLPARRMTEICARHDIACLNLAPRFAKLPAAERREIHLRGDGHWSASGHGHGAAETVRFLAEETGLWRGAVERVRQGRLK